MGRFFLGFVFGLIVRRIGAWWWLGIALVVLWAMGQYSLLALAVVIFGMWLMIFAPFRRGRQGRRGR